MAQTVYAFSPATGTHVFTARNTSGQWWNGSAFEAYNASNIAAYAIAATSNGNGHYSVSLDDSATSYDLRLRAGGSLATTDPAIDVYTTIASASSAPTAAAIADAVWDEAQSGHVTAGTFGAYLDSAVSAAGGGNDTFVIDGDSVEIT